MKRPERLTAVRIAALVTTVFVAVALALSATYTYAQHIYKLYRCSSKSYRSAEFGSTRCKSWFDDVLLDSSNTPIEEALRLGIFVFPVCFAVYCSTIFVSCEKTFCGQLVSLGLLLSCCGYGWTAADVQGLKELNDFTKTFIAFSTLTLFPAGFTLLLTFVKLLRAPAGEAAAVPTAHPTGGLDTSTSPTTRPSGEAPPLTTAPPLGEGPMYEATPTAYPIPNNANGRSHSENLVVAPVVYSNAVVSDYN